MKYIFNKGTISFKCNLQNYEVNLIMRQQQMEHQQFRKKVYMQTTASTLIPCQSQQLPQWTSETILNFTSAYDFASYNVQDQTMQILPRTQGQNQVMVAQFRNQLNERNCEIDYIFRQRQCFYLVHRKDSKIQKIIFYRNAWENREKMVEDFLDFLLNENEQMKSSRHLISRTQHMIQEINQQMSKERRIQDLKEAVHEMKDIKTLLMIHQCGFALVLVEMKQKNGLMLINLSKCAKEPQSQFFCPIVAANPHKKEPDLSHQQSQASRMVYIFYQKILQVHKTRDFTQFIVLSQRHIYLVKINFQLMELCFLDQMEMGTRFRGKIISLGVTHLGEEQFIVGLFQAKGNKFAGSKPKKTIKLFNLIQRKIVEVKESKRRSKAPKYECEEKTLKFLDDCCEKVGNGIKFSNNILRSQYQIDQGQDQSIFNDFNSNAIISVFNNIVHQEVNTQHQALQSKQQSFKQLCEKQQSQKSSFHSKAIKQIGGFIVNKGQIIIWQKESPTIHLCKLVSQKEQEDKFERDLEEENGGASRKEKQMKDMIVQLMGLPLNNKQPKKGKFSAAIEYTCSIELELTIPKISTISPSPNNYNLLILSNSGSEGKQNYLYSLFQLELFGRLANPDPSIFVKPFKNIYKKKPVQLITSSLVKDNPLFLTGNLIHTNQAELLEGALCFDIHPINLFMAVSFGFTTKVYAIEANDRLTSLFTLNGQGMKAVKYSPLGNHLCILFSKTIKIMDSYSFTQQFTIHQKNSNFMKCIFSSNGMQLYTLSQNHVVNIYSTFDYLKIDSIKPDPQISLTPNMRPINIRSFTKQSQYCLVLEGGSMLVKYKADAVVVNHQYVYHYEDGQKITAIEIDQKNGILFVGCGSGKLRAHVWPINQNFTFQNYSQIRISFNSITCLSLSNISPILHVGCQNGNITKIKFLIDKQKGSEGENQHNSLFAEKGFRNNMPFGGKSVEKIYKFALSNNSTVSQQLPEKLRLQYKLSQVIGRLNEEMKKLRLQIQTELEQKQKLNSQKFDINLYHHLSKMISTKLYGQLKDEEEDHHRQTQHLKQIYDQQIKNMVNEQSNLLKLKSITTSQHYQQRFSLRESLAQQLQHKIDDYRQQEINIEEKLKSAEKINKQGDPELFYLPNQAIEICKEEGIWLSQELQLENKKHYDLRKACTYKETAIRGMQLKKIKEETLQFKIQLQEGEMSKKLGNSQGIVKDLKNKIQEAEKKVHRVQAQASIIKSSAQFKKVVNIEQMNDACSYKLWMKQKTQNEIAQLTAYYRLLQELLEDKSNQMVDLVGLKDDKIDKVLQLQQSTTQRKLDLKIKKMALLDTRSCLKKIDPLNQFKQIKKINKSARNSPRKLRKTSEEMIRAKKSPSEQIMRAQSSRVLSRVGKDVTLYNSIMDKQMKFLRTSVKIHQRKVNKFGKQNGELLTEYEKLKYQQKQLRVHEQGNKVHIQTVKDEILRMNENGIDASLSQSQVQLCKTSFQKYLKNKKDKLKPAKYKTASCTPSHLRSLPGVQPF